MALAEPLPRTATDISPPGVEPGDAELLTRAIEGERGAFEALYCRHSEAAFRTACAAAGNRHDASDAMAEAFTSLFQRINDGRLAADVNFKAYLLTSVRNAARDHQRAQARRTPTDDDAVFDSGRVTTTPAEVLVGTVEAGLIARAFSDLPERWRSVLWLTEVEGLTPAAAAQSLGTSANNTAQLAHRARTRLRERYLTAHVDSTELSESCRFTTERLGAYVGGGLSARDTAKVCDHLEGCQECRDRLALVEDVGSTLRRAMLPLPLALAGTAGAAKLIAGAGLIGVGASAATGAGVLGKVGMGFSNLPKWAQTAAAGAGAAAVAAASLVVVGIGGDDESSTRAGGSPFGGDSASAGPPASDDISTTDTDEASRSFADPRRSPFAPRFPRSSAPAPPGDEPDGGGADDRGLPGGDVVVTPPPPARPVPVAQAGLGGQGFGHHGGAALGVGSGGSTGAHVDDTEVGQSSQPDGDDGITVSTGGSRLPAQRIDLP